MMLPKTKRKRSKPRAKVSGEKYGECELTGEYGWLEPHHIFNGEAYLRVLSEKYGAVVYIIHSHHEYIHKNASYRKKLKVGYQRKIMHDQGWSIDQFIKVFGKSYI